MARFLIVNDENGILRFLFSNMAPEVGMVEYVDSVPQGIALATGGGFDIIIIQGLPTGDFLGGMSPDQYLEELVKKIPPDTVLFVTNFKSIRTQADLSAFGVSDFIVSGALLRTILTGKAQASVASRKEAAEKEKLKKSLVQVANIFQSLLDMEDPFQKGNIESIVTCSAKIAEILKLPPEIVSATEVAASLYDIGKIGIQKDVLWKKSGLDDKQQDAMKNHPLVACDLLKDIPFPWNILPIIRHHHERFDGNGYPDGLKGREIPIGSRVIAVVDAFHAMISRRPYRQVFHTEEALREINAKAGIQFDPEVVEVFMEVARKHFSDQLQKGSLKILLVDDDIKNLARLKIVLDLEGYEVITARNVEDGITLAGTQYPDLIVSELILKDLESHQLLEYVRNNPDLEETLFIFLSTGNNAADRIKAYRMGADDFIPKPYELGEFVLKIENLFKRTKKYKNRSPVPKRGGVVGNLKEFLLPDLLQVLDYGIKTALVMVRSSDQEGRIYVEAGKIKYVIQGELSGEEALGELFRWQDGVFTLEHGVTKNKNNVYRDNALIILDAMKRREMAGGGTEPSSFS